VQSSEPGIASFEQRVDQPTTAVHAAAELAFFRLRQSIGVLVLQWCGLQRRGIYAGVDHSCFRVVVERAGRLAACALTLACRTIRNLKQPVMLAFHVYALSRIDLCLHLVASLRTMCCLCATTKAPDPADS
jgi:hypothetical protein